MKKIETTLWDVMKSTVESHNVSLYDVEYVKEDGDMYLRIYIENTEEGIDLDKCAAVSRHISDLLDEEDPIEESYFLEVSSPGIDRVLRRPEHYLDHIGEEVEIKWKEKGKKKSIGILESYSDGEVKVDGNSIVLEKIKKMKVHVKF